MTPSNNVSSRVRGRVYSRRSLSTMDSKAITTTQHNKPNNSNFHKQRSHTQQQCPTQGNDQGFFAQPVYTSRSSPTAGPQLPPLRSVVEVPEGDHNSTQLPQPFPHFPQRNMSLGSNVSSGSYSSLSSSDGYGGQSLSPRELPIQVNNHDHTFGTIVSLEHSAQGRSQEQGFQIHSGMSAWETRICKRWFILTI